MNPCYTCGFSLGSTQDNLLWVAIQCENRKDCERKGKRHLVCGRCFHQLNRTGLLTSMTQTSDVNVPLYMMTSACPTKEFLVGRMLMSW